mmetsp:Transcript_41399/g.119153  ORF Transcript_41399/g.119153 Transcript_41399/m.119153 type:complete len:226 (+) Transcript_41399:316-993(+)
MLLVQLHGLVDALERESSCSTSAFPDLVIPRRAIRCRGRAADDAQRGADRASEDDETRASAYRRASCDGLRAASGGQGVARGAGPLHAELHGLDLLFHRDGGRLSLTQALQVRDPVQDLAPVLHELGVVLGMCGQRQLDPLSKLSLRGLVLGDGSRNITLSVELDGLILKLAPGDDAIPALVHAIRHRQLRRARRNLHERRHKARGNADACSAAKRLNVKRLEPV